MRLEAFTVLFIIFFLLFQPSYQVKKKYGEDIDWRGRPIHWDRPYNIYAPKLHYLVVVWGGGWVFGPYFYPRNDRGFPIMKGETHLA